MSTMLTLASTPSRSSFRWVSAKILSSKLRLEPLTLQDLGLTLLTLTRILLEFLFLLDLLVSMDSMLSRMETLSLLTGAEVSDLKPELLIELKEISELALIVLTLDKPLLITALRTRFLLTLKLPDLTSEFKLLMFVENLNGL